MIIVTGAYGFIGSCLIRDLIDAGYKNIIAVDDFSSGRKINNLNGKNVTRINRNELFSWMGHRRMEEVEFFIHLGARTDTTEKDETLLEKLNLEYSKEVFKICSDRDISLIYASSAATYGNGDYGYTDNAALIPRLQPLNPYGWSKQLFDLWTINRGFVPQRWYGLKFFNVYGPNEYHKDKMASVVFHAFNQIRTTGKMNLFKSHRMDIQHGHQARDFIYVKDVSKVIIKIMQTDTIKSGIYNLGTGKARTFLDLVHATCDAMEVKPNIHFIDTPEEIRDTYQYFTESRMEKLQEQGLDTHFTSLEDGVRNYVQAYLMKDRYH